MPVYAKLTKSTDPRFHNRETIIMTAAEEHHIPIPDDVVLCNGCNQNISELDPPDGYLVYLGKRELQADQPYDIYCVGCLKRYFPKAIMVEGG